MTARPDWVCGTCNGSGYDLMHSETTVVDGKVYGIQACPSPHVGPFLVEGRELWADPECGEYFVLRSVEEGL